MNWLIQVNLQQKMNMNLFMEFMIIQKLVEPDGVKKNLAFYLKMIIVTT